MSYVYQCAAVVACRNHRSRSLLRMRQIPCPRMSIATHTTDLMLFPGLPSSCTAPQIGKAHWPAVQTDMSENALIRSVPCTALLTAADICNQRHDFLKSLDAPGRLMTRCHARGLGAALHTYSAMTVVAAITFTDARSNCVSSRLCSIILTWVPFSQKNMTVSLKDTHQLSIACQPKQNENSLHQSWRIAPLTFSMVWLCHVHSAEVAVTEQLELFMPCMIHGLHA